MSNELIACVIVTLIVGALVACGYAIDSLRAKKKEEWDAYMSPKVYTPEDQEALDKRVDLVANRAASDMFEEYLENRRRHKALYGDLKWFVHIPLIPPYLTVLEVHPGCISRHADGGYQKLVMDKYHKLIEDYGEANT